MPSLGWAQPWDETLVDPELRDCSGTLAWLGDPAGNARPGAPAPNGNYDIDADGAFGAGAEDMDMDAIYGTIATAIAAGNLNATGVCEVTVPGIYREALTIAQSLTLRAPAGTDVILEGARNGLCTVSNGTGITITGNNITVLLENLTIRGFRTAGVLVSNCTGCKVTLVDCRIEDNELGLVTNGADPDVRLVDTRVNANTTAGLLLDGSPVRLSGCNVTSNTLGIQVCGESGVLAIADSDVSSNLTDGIGPGDCLGPQSWGVAIVGSRFERNGDDGIELATAPAAAALWSVRLSDSHVAGNGDDGVRVKSNTGTRSPVVLADNEVVGNVGDGVETQGAGAATLDLVIWDSTFAANGVGLRDSGNTTVQCHHNLLGSNGGCAAPVNVVPNPGPFGACIVAGVDTEQQF